MARHRKTRQEKIISDLRRKLQTANPAEDPSKKSEIKISLRNAVAKTTPFINANEGYSYLYLKHDLLRTSAVTLIISFLDLLLFFTLKKHILLPTMGY